MKTALNVVQDANHLMDLLVGDAYHTQSTYSFDALNPRFDSMFDMKQRNVYKVHQKGGIRSITRSCLNPHESNK